MKHVLSITVSALVFSSLTVQAQHSGKIPLIGVLHPSSAEIHKSRNDAFLQSLHQLGYFEGKNINIEYRYAGGKRERYGDLADQIVGSDPDVIVVASSDFAVAAKQATSTIPIIIANATDPVGTGLVASLAHPGGNITGLTSISPEVSGKRLELLKDTVPRASVVAVLWHSLSLADKDEVKATEIAGRDLKLKLHVVSVTDPEEFQSAFASMIQAKVNAFVIISGAFTNFHRKSILELAEKNHLPSMCERPDLVQDGCLMSYGPDTLYLWTRAAAFVDKILKGRKPADLPVEQPTKFELVINLKTAKQIGLTIPPNVLARADRVIR
jgi:putative ABC transport system substrate-binding protein